MKFIPAILMFTTFLVSVSAANETCTLDDGSIFNQGAFYFPIGMCQRRRCEGNNEWSAVGCPEVSIPPGLECEHIPMDFSKPYPECCQQFNC